jgi:hypothetical protein
MAENEAGVGAGAAETTPAERSAAARERLGETHEATRSIPRAARKEIAYYLTGFAKQPPTPPLSEARITGKKQGREKSREQVEAETSHPKYLLKRYEGAFERGERADPTELIRYLEARAGHKLRQADGADPNVVDRRSQKKAGQEWRRLNQWLVALGGEPVTEYAEREARPQRPEKSIRERAAEIGPIYRPYGDHAPVPRPPSQPRPEPPPERRPPPRPSQRPAEPEPPERPPTPQFEEGARVTWVDEEGVEHTGIVRKGSAEEKMPDLLPRSAEEAPPSSEQPTTEIPPPRPPLPPPERQLPAETKTAAELREYETGLLKLNDNDLAEAVRNEKAQADSKENYERLGIALQELQNRVSRRLQEELLSRYPEHEARIREGIKDGGEFQSLTNWYMGPGGEAMNKIYYDGESAEIAIARAKEKMWQELAHDEPNTFSDWQEHKPATPEEKPPEEGK